MTESWMERVEVYVGRVEEVTDAIDEILDESRVHTLSREPDKVTQVQQRLIEAVGQLEELVRDRDALLHDPQAPSRGLTLTEKLLSTRRIDDARLAKRCGDASARVESTHQRAVSLFVCQFHLAELGNDLIQGLSGSIGTPTYGAQRSSRGQGGGLFNEAA